MHCPAPRGTQAHCTSVRSDNRWTFHPGTQQQSGYRWLRHGGLCDPPRICLPRPSPTHHQTGHTWWCYRKHNGHHDVSRLFHACHISVNLLSSVKRIGCQWQTCLFCCSLMNASRVTRCWAVITGPNRGHQALMPPSWNLLEVIVALTVLLQSLLTQSSTMVLLLGWFPSTALFSCLV